MIQTKKHARIITTSGVGGFLNPPTHPAHTMRVETDLNLKKEHRGGMSLSAAANSDWHDQQFAAKKILSDWVAPDINSPEIQDWIKQVMGYFSNCYTPTSGARDAGSLLIKPDWNPVTEQDRHAGVLLIRDYYTDFVLTAKHVKRGKK
jgi:hypothetical protein